MRFSTGWKYRTEDAVVYKLQCTYNKISPHRSRYFQITHAKDSWWLIIHSGYAWDGATWFPDVGWMMTPSLLHDVLHEAIAIGVISVADNSTIDRELDLAVQGNPATRWSKKKLLALRGFYIRTATNRVDQKEGEHRKSKEAPRLANEYTIQEFVEMTQ